MKTEKKKLQGSALFTVVSVMAILILFLTGTLALATASNNRAHKSYAISQADYTAKAAIRSFRAAVIQDASANGDNLRLAMATLAESPDPDLTITPEITISDTTMGNVGYWDPTSDPANPAWVDNRITLSHVPNQFEYVFNETTGQWEQWRVIMLTATCRVGREEETVNTFISIQPGRTKIEIENHPGGYWVKGGGGSEVKGLQEAGGASFENGGNIFGGLGVNLAAGGSNDLIVLDNQFSTYSPLNFINGNAYLKTSTFNINVEDNAGSNPPSATVITGSFIAKNNSWIHVNYKMKGDYTNRDIPYFYVGGVLASPTGTQFPLVDGNGSPFNVFCGTLYCPEQLTANADFYLMDKPSDNEYDSIDTGDSCVMPAVKYGHNVLGRKDGPSGLHLYNWAADTVNRRNDDYSLGGSIYCNGDLEIWNAIIEGDVRVKGKLSINGNTRIKGDIVVENAYENAGKEGAARVSGLTFGNNATQTSVRQGFSAAEIGHIYSIKDGAGQVITRMKDGYSEADGLYPGCAKVKNLKLENIAIEDAQVAEGKYMYNGTVYDSKPYFLVEPTKAEYAEGETAQAATNPPIITTDQFSYFQLASNGALMKVDDKPVVTFAEYTFYDEEGNETDEASVSGKHYLDPEGNRVTRYTDAFDIVFDPNNPDTYDVASYPYQVYPDELTRESIYGVGETNASNKTKLITTLTDVRKGLNMDVSTGYFDDKIYTRLNPYDTLIAEETDPEQKEILQQKKADHTLTGTLSSEKVITRPKDGAEWYILKDYTISGDNARLLIADNASAGASTNPNAKYKGGIIRFYVEGTLLIDNRAYIQLQNMPTKISYKDDFGIEFYSGGYVYDKADPSKKNINPTEGGLINIHNQSMMVGAIKAPYLKLMTNNSDGKGKWAFTYESEKGEVAEFYPTLIGNALVDKLTQAQNGFNLCFTKSGSGSSGSDADDTSTWVDTSYTTEEEVPDPSGRLYRFTYCAG